MPLTLYMHPLSSFCHKVLIALYENQVAFKAHSVNLGDAGERSAFQQVWPIAKFPVLIDSERKQTIPESTSIIEYLQLYFPGPSRLIPQDPFAAAEVRHWDRLFDWHLHDPMQKVVGDKLRPADGHDPIGVSGAQDRIRTTLTLVEKRIAGKQWAVGDVFTLADCAAAPPLFFINKMTPLAQEFPNMSAYLKRLTQRPSYARTLDEAVPYLSMFPG